MKGILGASSMITGLVIREASTYLGNRIMLTCELNEFTKRVIYCTPTSSYTSDNANKHRLQAAAKEE